MGNIQEITSIIETSGNSFHIKVVNSLKSKDWQTMISPYYLDEISNKPREIDLVAEKVFEYGDRRFNEQGYINVQLFIECKYIKENIVFWFDHKDFSSAKKSILSNTPLEENNVFFEKHSYLTKNKMVAKLFSSKKTKQNQEHDPFYKALNQSLHSLVYLRLKGSITHSPKKRYYSFNTSISYPVIICNSFDNFYKVEITNQNSPKRITENFQLEVNYAYRDDSKRTINEFFLIDVISINNLDKYLNSIVEDVELFKNVLY